MTEPRTKGGEGRRSYKIISFETFAAQNGASRQDIGDCSLHRSSEHVSPKQHKRFVEAQAVRDQALINRRAELRVEFARLVAEWYIREPTLRERLVSVASFDSERGRAARRLLARLATPPTTPAPTSDGEDGR